MDFSVALVLLKAGTRVYRNAWSDQKFIFLVKGSEFQVNRPPLSDFYDVGTPILYQAHIDVQYGNGHIGVWSPSVADVLADDWTLL